MATNCSIYKHGILLGSGSVADGSATVSSWSAAANTPAIARRNVQVAITGVGVHQGRTFNTRVLSDNGATLTLKDVCPFVGA